MPLQSQMQVKLVFLVATLFLFQNHAQATAVFDSAFGTNGRIVTTVGDEAAARATIIQPDGKIIVAGDVQRTFFDRDAVLVRYNSNGTHDADFGNNGKVITTILNQTPTLYAVALQPDGKIVVAGDIQPEEGSTVSDFLVARFNSNGSLDANFGNGGAVVLNQSQMDSFSAVVVQPDGKIVAAGSTSQNNYEGAIVRFNTDGTLDAGFGSGGRVFISLPNLSNERFRALALLSNGRILAGGVAFNQPLADILVQLKPDGTLAPDFGNQGIVINNLPNVPFPPGFDLAVLPDNKILTVSSFIRRYLGNGEIDSSLAVTYNHGGGENIAAMPNGNFIVTRSRTFASSGGVWLYHRSGRFIGGRASFNLATNDVAVQPDGKIITVNSPPPSDSFVVTRLLSFTSIATRLADYDGDEQTDVTVYRPSNRTLYVLRSAGGTFSYTTDRDATRIIPEFFGAFGGGVVVSTFVYWQEPSSPGTPAYFYGATAGGGSIGFQWGVAGDIPVGGDYDNDGRTDFTVFRPQNGAWYSNLSSNNGFRAVFFGQIGDKPVPADYDYDGITDVAVFRPSSGVWYVRRSSDEGLTAVQFGTNGDIPLTGDFDGDGRADFVVFRPSEGIWYLLGTTQGFRAVQFGLSTDFPVPGDYDGDGRHDVAVFRQGVWYILGSSRGFYAVQWGLPTDVPVAVRYAFY